MGGPPSRGAGVIFVAHIVSVDTASLSAKQAQTAYLTAIDGTLGTDFLQDPFSARLTACEIGSIRVIRLLASARRSTRLREQITLDRHDGVGFQLAISGHASGRAGWKMVESTPGSIMILDYSKPFWIEDHEEREIVNLAIPRFLLENRCSNIAKLHGTVITGAPTLLLANLLQVLPAAMDSIGEQHCVHMQEILLNSIEIMLNPDLVQISVSGDDKLFRKAIAAIDRRIGSADLCPALLASKLGISRGRLYKLFEAHGGVSRAIWQRRLERSREALLNPADRRKIGAIAYDHGFSSDAHFARAFRKAFGISASAMRRSAASASEEPLTIIAEKHEQKLLRVTR